MIDRLILQRSSACVIYLFFLTAWKAACTFNHYDYTSNLRVDLKQRETGNNMFMVPGDRNSATQERQMLHFRHSNRIG